MSEVEKRLGDLADEINAEHRAFGGAFRKTLEHGIRAGELLAEAKAQCPHGTWLEWLAVNFDGSARVAQEYMRLYNHRDEIRSKTQDSAHLSVSGALKELAAPVSNIPARERVILDRAREMDAAGHRMSALSPNMEGMERDSDEKRRGFVAETAWAAMICSVRDYIHARGPLDDAHEYGDTSILTPELLVEVGQKMEKATEELRWWVGECEWIEAQIRVCDWPPGRNMPNAAFDEEWKHLPYCELYLDDDEFVRSCEVENYEFQDDKNGYGLPSPRAEVRSRCGVWVV